MRAGAVCELVLELRHERKQVVDGLCARLVVHDDARARGEVQRRLQLGCTLCQRGGVEAEGRWVVEELLVRGVQYTAPASSKKT